MLNVPATCLCISGTDLLRQFYVLPHWDRSCRSNFLPHPVTVYWHRADQSQRWPYNARRLAGLPLECQFLSHWYDSTPKKSRCKRDSNPGSSALEADALPLGQRGGSERGIILSEVKTWYLACTETITREAIECNRYFPAAIINELNPWNKAKWKKSLYHLLVVTV